VARRTRARTQREILTRIVEGQVRSFINDHPDAVPFYVRKYMPKSLAKRIVGDMLSKETLRRLVAALPE
jgi:hypothetical protein